MGKTIMTPKRSEAAPTVRYRLLGRGKTSSDAVLPIQHTAPPFDLQQKKNASFRLPEVEAPD